MFSPLKSFLLNGNPILLVRSSSSRRQCGSSTIFFQILDIFKYRIGLGQDWVVDLSIRPIPDPCLVSGQIELVCASLLGVSGRVLGKKTWIVPNPWIVVGQNGLYPPVVLVGSGQVGFFRAGRAGRPKSGLLEMSIGRSCRHSPAPPLGQLHGHQCKLRRVRGRAPGLERAPQGPR